MSCKNRTSTTRPNCVGLIQAEQNWVSYKHITATVYTASSVTCQLNPLELHRYVACVYVIRGVNWTHQFVTTLKSPFKCISTRQKNRSTKKNGRTNIRKGKKKQIKWPISCCWWSGDFCNFMNLSFRSGLFLYGRQIWSVTLTFRNLASHI